MSVELSLKNEEEECAKSAFRCGETVIFDIWINDKQDNLRKPRAPSVYIYTYICTDICIIFICIINIYIYLCVYILYGYNFISPMTI